MSRLYNGEEARRKLRCSARTFSTWVKDANVVPAIGTDSRERLYSLEQLRLIVKQDPRRRELLSDAQAFGTEESSDETRVAIERYEREIEDLRAEIEALKTEKSEQMPLNVEGLKDELLAYLRREIAAGIEAVRKELEEGYHRRLTELEQRLQKSVVEPTLSAPTKSETSPSVVPTPAHRPARTSVTQLSANQRLIISNIPTNRAKGERPHSFFEITRTEDGLLVAFGEFVELHDVSLSTAKHAKDRANNPLPVVAVHWPKANGYIDWALDVAGQAKLYEFYSIRPDFRRCELCPHTPDKYDHLEEFQKQ